MLAELDIETAERTAHEIRAAIGAGDSGGANGASEAKMLAVQTDVTQSASVQHAVSEGECAFGALDVLVNNAGINVFCDPLTMTVMFLASDEAPFINATCITVDGGRSAVSRLNVAEQHATRSKQAARTKQQSFTGRRAGRVCHTRYKKTRPIPSRYQLVRRHAS